MLYTESHEWIRIEGDVGTVGITAYARKELGEIVYAELPLLGKKVRRGEEIAVLESTKAAADIYTPVGGEIVAINEALASQIDLIQTDPEGKGWLFKIALSCPQELDSLLSPSRYHELIQVATQEVP